MKSNHRAWLTLASFSIVALVVGYYLAGRNGMLWALVVSLGINTLIYLYMDSSVLNLFRGKLIEGQDPWGVSKIVDQLVKKARIPQPNVLVINTTSPQAYIIGKNWHHSHIVLTKGLLERMDERELRAILAYCVATIRRQDSFVQLIATAFTSFLLWAAGIFDRIYRWLVGIKNKEPLLHNQPVTFVMAPLAGALLKVTIHQRDYISTDALAASYLNSPQDLASALWKLESYSLTLPLQISPSLAHGFVVNPLTAKGWTRYFQSHPSVKKRIEKLIGYYPV